MVIRTPWFAYLSLLAGIVLSLTLGLLAMLAGPEAAKASPPQGFQDNLVANVPGGALALDFTPDGRMIVANRPGRLLVYRGTQPLRGPGNPALDISGRVCANVERGLLGMALDPNFASNRFVYVYYTFRRSGCATNTPGRPVNRVSRFTFSGNGVVPGSERVLINNIPSTNGNHNAGDVKFGRDGNLYISTGDGGCYYNPPTSNQCQTENTASRDRYALLGKILRINPTANGSVIPAGNPFTGPSSRRCNEDGRTAVGRTCREIFATGLRNPFRMAFDPDAQETSFRINDVGAATWEEIDVGERGADYGWNCREARRINSNNGKCDPPVRGLDYPIYRYNHDTGCESITGGAFVPNGGDWPNSYDSAYLFGDFTCDRIFDLRRNPSGGFRRTLFATIPGPGPVALAFGPFANGRALYYTTFANGGQVRLIDRTAG